MRYELARKVAEAFQDLNDGLEVSVAHDVDNAVIRVTKTWAGVARIPLRDFLGKTEDQACTMLMNVTEKLVAGVLERKKDV
jgi:hypothetical protein